MKEDKLQEVDYNYLEVDCILGNLRELRRVVDCTHNLEGGSNLGVVGCRIVGVVDCNCNFDLIGCNLGLRVVGVNCLKSDEVDC